VAIIETLQPHHDRKAFDCGRPALNAFLQRQARQNADRNIGVTHVVVPAPEAPEIMGYYTLVTRTLECERVANAARLPSGPIGVVLLGRLAVDHRHQGKGLGRRMLLRAIRQTERAGREIGIYALALHAIDDAARGWHLSLGYGFEPLLDDPNYLILPMATIRQLELSEG
jgi:GNAT superfamily N-acetyltransferase